MSYIFNKNHNRTHLPGCRAVDMMNRDKNEVEVEEPQGHLCLWCHPGTGSHCRSRQTALGRSRQDDGLNPHIGEEICTDPSVREIFKKAGCIDCGSSLGDIRMYPHEGGIEVSGHSGKWWVYFSCFDCGYENALWKALNKLKSQSQERCHDPVKVVH